MENATKAIIIAASVLITMAIVSLGFLVFNLAQNFGNKGLTEAEIKLIKLLEDKYTKYEDSTVSGFGVISAIEECQDSSDEKVGVCVVTGVGGATNTNWYVFDASDIDHPTAASKKIEDAKNIDKPETYINPAGKFKASVQRDSRKKIASITFVQQ